MKGTAAQVRAFAGPALLSFGFRPFFLFGALWAAVALALTLPALSGHLGLPTTLTPIEWHAHELVYGYVPAVVAGFLLTAVPNWTGRLPVVGLPLLALFLLWLAGRIAMLTSAWIGPLPAAATDLVFLLALGAVIGREIVAGNSTRNLKVLAVVSLLFLGNALFHVEHIRGTDSGYGIRLGVAAAVLLIALIGGRIVPSFTRNWLVPRGAGRLPAPMDRLDYGAMAVSAVALASWVVSPAAQATALLAALGFLVNAARLGRWAGDRTTAEPLVLILHIAYAFVPIGFLLVALATLWPGSVAPTGAMHGWTAGAIGLMTLAVMTRASLGHCGRPLQATGPIQLIYLAALVAALSRVATAFGIEREVLLHVSVTAWIAAFAGFVIVYAPLLARRRA